MNRKKIILIVGIAVLFVTLMVLLFSGSSSTGDNTYTTKKWNVTYDLDDDGPYGLSFLERLMISSGRYSAFDVYTSHKQLDSLANNLGTTIMFVGEKSYLTYGEINELLEVVKNGNQLFLALEKFPFYLMDELIEYPNARFISSEKVTVQIDNKKLDQYFIYNTDTLTYFWNVFEKDVLKSNPIMESHSTIQGYPNFVSLPFGSGTITLHLNPMFFVNFQLKRREGFEHLLKTMDVIEHDEIHYLAFARESLKDVDATDKLGSSDHSILAEVFKYDSLKWSFIFFVIGALLFFVCRARRSQEPIPVVESKTNNGIGFADTIAGIYYGRNKPHYLLKIMRRNFYENVKSSFFVDLKNRKSQKPIEILSEKSGFTTDKINYLLNYLEDKEKEITNDRLVKLDRDLREFYILSGAWSSEKLNKIENNYSNVYRIKATGLGHIIGGLLTIIFGFVMLSYAKGYGVLLWPLGIIFIYLGSKSLKTPIIRMNKKYIEITPLIGKPYKELRSSIKKIHVEGNYLIFETREGKRLKLNLSTVSLQDRIQLTNLKTKN
jgi:hypothetical protein